MANQSNPDDPYRSDDEFRRAARLDNKLQPDPELAEGPASSGKIAMFAIVVAAVLGAVFYGLNSSSIHQAGTSSTAQNTQSSRPADPPASTGAGATTGAAPAHPQTPPSSSPTGQDLNRSGNPPTNAPGK